MITGSLFVVLGLVFFKAGGFLTGGIVGLSLVVSKLTTSVSFGQILFVINVPFYWLAFKRMGKRFTFNTFLAVAAVSVMSDYSHRVIQLPHVEPVLAAILGGSLVGVGMLVLFRHNASLGGIGILCLYLQDRYGWNAGRIQMLLDACIVGIGFFLVSPWILALSVLGAAALNVVIAMNHKPGRYQIT
ncbi:hypothetical protein CHH28_06300 [Bacterioplanes sanyensis]|uniref:YitT family protein n=2 Tax=Bacterioplanes sanyensis TaxID=1249553 RepID=A0A222FP97_9GAMM|nr:hypothetical protein CHH28_06300 [Bacterioplanes sanyensis]